MTVILTNRARNWSLAVLCMAGALNLFDRQIINILTPDIKAELKLSDFQLGLLTGTAFALFYSVLGIPLGRLADRGNRVRLISISLVLWSGFTALCGLATGFVQLFFMRLCVGIGEAGFQPASTSLIPDLFPEGRRTTAMSVLLVGGPIGAFMGFLVGGFVGPTWGWRAAFTVAGIPGLVLAAIMFTTLRDHRTPDEEIVPHSAPDDRSTALWSALLMLLRRPGLVAVLIGNACTAFIIGSLGAWLPLFFIRVHGLSTMTIGTFSAIAVGPAGAFGLLGMGAICDRLRRGVREVESKAMIVSLVVIIPILLVTILSDDSSVALCAMILLYFNAYAFLAPTLRLMQITATPKTHALAVALVNAAGNILSSAFGLPLVGAISDMLTKRYGLNGIRYALLVLVAAALLGIVAHSRAWQSQTLGRNSNVSVGS